LLCGSFHFDYSLLVVFDHLETTFGVEDILLSSNSEFSRIHQRLTTSVVTLYHSFLIFILIIQYVFIHYDCYCVCFEYE